MLALPEVRPVEKIERFGTELEAHAFARQVETLPQTKVCLIERVTPRHVPSRVSERLAGIGGNLNAGPVQVISSMLRWPSGVRIGPTRFGR